MFKDILNKNQTWLLPLIKEFKKEFYLVGGTSIALHLGHRQSIDFDLFKTSKINKKKIIDKITSYNLTYKLLYSESNQIHLIINGVKLTFFEYGFDVQHKIKFEDIITLPDLIDLAALKAYALGRRAKWKDYVDLYFILKNSITIKQISEKANEIFKELFSIKIFKQQLCYFKDIDYSEEVIYMNNHYISNEEIKEFLIQTALEKI